MSVIKKIKWWMWVLFPIALLVLIVLFFRRGGGLGALLRTPPRKSSVPGSSAPAVTHEVAEEKREEITEEAEAERKEIDEKFEDEAKVQTDDWLKRLE